MDYRKAFGTLILKGIVDVNDLMQQVAEFVVCLLQEQGILVEVITQHAHHFVLQQVLTELYKPCVVTYLFVEAPAVVDEKTCLKV